VHLTKVECSKIETLISINFFHFLSRATEKFQLKFCATSEKSCQVSPVLLARGKWCNHRPDMKIYNTFLIPTSNTTAVTPGKSGSLCHGMVYIPTKPDRASRIKLYREKDGADETECKTGAVSVKRDRK